jgi:hypothetical protein
LLGAEAFAHQTEDRGESGATVGSGFAWLEIYCPGLKWLLLLMSSSPLQLIQQCVSSKLEHQTAQQEGLRVL